MTASELRAQLRMQQRRNRALQAVSPEEEKVASGATGEQLAVPSGVEVARCRWLFQIADLEPGEAYFAPAVTRTEALAAVPGTVAAEPVLKRCQRALNYAEEEDLRRLVPLVCKVINEPDSEQALTLALADPVAALACYRTLAHQHRVPIELGDDDRHRCHECANLAGNGRCLAVRRGELLPGDGESIGRNYTPIADLSRHCTSFTEPAKRA